MLTPNNPSIQQSNNPTIHPLCSIPELPLGIKSASNLRMLTPESRRRDFPTLDRMIYLNTAAEGIPPATIGQALQEYWRDKLEGMRGRDAHFARYEQCRVAAAHMVGLAPSEVSFCSCSSKAYNLLADAIEFKGKDEVVITDLDFPSGATPWFCNPARPKIKLWKSQEGDLLVADLLPLLNKRTRLVQVSLVSFYNGHRLRWAPFIGSVRSCAPNAFVSVDVTQAIGRIVLDCSDADCIISSTHKWLLGLHGGCIVGIRERSAARLTARAGGWFHLTNAFEPDRFERVVSKQGAPSFSVGMPNFASIYALNAACQYIDAVSVTEIARQADPLVSVVHRGISELGLAPMTSFDPANTGGIVAFQHSQSALLHAALDQQHIQVMHSAGRIRISIHGYNTLEDVQNFLTSLSQVIPARPAQSLAAVEAASTNAGRSLPGGGA